jgi:hypothetical protein
LTARLRDNVRITRFDGHKQPPSLSAWTGSIGDRHGLIAESSRTSSARAQHACEKSLRHFDENSANALVEASSSDTENAAPRCAARRAARHGLVHHVNVVVVSAESSPTKIIDRSSIGSVVQPLSSSRTPGDHPMDQCSTGTTSHQSYRRPRHRAGARSRSRNRLSLQDPTVLTDQRLGAQPPAGKR